MRRETEAALTTRVRKLIETGSTDSADAIYHLPIRNFVDLDYHQAELEGLFYPYPQAVGFVSERVPVASSRGLPRVACL